MSRIGDLVRKEGSPKDHEKYDKAYHEDIVSSPAKISTLLESFSFHNAETEDLLKDFEYYVINSKQRRAETWAVRDSWFSDSR